MEKIDYNFTRPFFAQKSTQEIERMQNAYEKTLGKDLTFKFGKTTVQFYVMGLGDVMIAREFGHDFLKFCTEHGDPLWGNVVICGGNTAAYIQTPRRDLNLLWWWSMGRRDDWLEHYLEHADTPLDFVLCPSKATLAKAQSLGLKTIYLPLAAGMMFQPFEQVRSGIGYAGNRKHKDQVQERAIIDGASSRYDIDWVDNIKSSYELNAWYNTKKIALGMTESVQARWGMVNNRVFEALASGTPFILYKHCSIEEILGLDYPYQSASPEQTLYWVDTILENYPQSLSKFEDLSAYVRANHSYINRILSLQEHL